MHNMAQEQHDRMALLLAAIGFVRPVVRYGRPYAEALFKKFFGDKDIDVEEIFANVDWNALQDETPTEGSSGSRRGWRRALGFDDLHLTPSQQQPQQQQQQQAEQVQQRQQPQHHAAQGPVTIQVSRLEIGQSLLPVNNVDETPIRPTQQTDDGDKLNKQQIDNVNEQNLYKGLRAILVLNLFGGSD